MAGGPCTEIEDGIMYVNFNVYGSTGARAESPANLLGRLQDQIANPGSPIWKGYATRYIREEQALTMDEEAQFTSCVQPTFEWMLLDEGAGMSMTYAMTDMGSHVYIGGDTTGNLTLVGASGVPHHYQHVSADADMYIAQITSTGEPRALMVIDGEPGMGNRLMDIAPNADGVHLEVGGYFRGTITFNNGALSLNNPNTNSAH